MTFGGILTFLPHGAKKLKSLADHTSLFSENTTSLFSESSASLISENTTLLFSDYTKIIFRSLVLVFALAISQFAFSQSQSQLVFKQKSLLVANAQLSITDPFYASDNTNNHVETSRKLKRRLVYTRDDATDVYSAAAWTYKISCTTNNNGTSVDLELLYNSSQDVYEAVYIEDVSASGADFTLSVNTITHTGSVPGDITLELELISERHEFLDITDIPLVIYDASSSLISWPTIDGAVEYDLQWVFIDYHDNTVFSPPSPSGEEPFIYKEGTSVRLKQNSFEFENIYPQGTVYFRVRAVGRYLETLNSINGYDYIKLGAWGYRNASSSITKLDVSSDFEINKNWQYVVSFA